MSKTGLERKMDSLTKEGSVSVVRINKENEIHMEEASPVTVIVNLDPAEEIRNAHQAGIRSMSNSLVHFTKAGEILTKVREEVEDFSKWCKENLEFNRKTAYQYLKLFELNKSGALDLDSGKYTSIRQCLGIDHDGEKSTYSRSADQRFESIPGLCSKIEQYWKKACKSKPVTSWSDDERRLLANSIKPLMEIYKSLL
jgi:hypothetical protein